MGVEQSEAEHSAGIGQQQPLIQVTALGTLTSPGTPGPEGTIDTQPGRTTLQGHIRKLQSGLLGALQSCRHLSHGRPDQVGGVDPQRIRRGMVKTPALSSLGGPVPAAVSDQQGTGVHRA